MVVDHAKGTLPAAYDALAAEKAPVSVIGNYKLFFFPVLHRHNDRIGWTIHGA